MSNARASVVLPVKDGAAHLPQLLPALASQAFDGELEVLAIFSLSLLLSPTMSGLPREEPQAYQAAKVSANDRHVAPGRATAQL